MVTIDNKLTFERSYVVTIENKLTFERSYVVTIENKLFERSYVTHF